MPCKNLALDAGYLSRIPGHAQSLEVYVRCSFWEPIGACGFQTRIDGIPHEDHNHTKLGSVKECELVVRYSGTYGILNQVYQKLCPNHCAYGEIVEVGCHVLLER